MAKKTFTLSRLTTVAVKMHLAQEAFFTHTKNQSKKDTPWYAKRKELLDKSKELERQHKALLAAYDGQHDDLIIGEIDE